MLKNKNLGVVQKEVLTFDQESSLTPVSYTHLTLPTIYSV